MKIFFKRLLVVTIIIIASIIQSYGQKMIGSISVGNTSSACTMMTKETNYGIFVKNNKDIKVKTIYINIANTPQASMPFILKIMQGDVMTKPNYTYDAKDFKDIILPIECQAKKSGIYSIDMSKHNLDINGDFIVALYPADCDLKDYKYMKMTSVPKLLPNGDILGSEKKNIEYMGPTIVRSKEGVENVFTFGDFSGSYGYLGGKLNTRRSPMIAIQTY